VGAAASDQLDNQIIAETQAMVTSHGLPRGLGHIYVMFLPKHVESCFYPGATNTANNECTINHLPSAAHCAYHSAVTYNAIVYANMPFPIYSSPVGFTCCSDGRFPVIETPDRGTRCSPSYPHGFVSCPLGLLCNHWSAFGGRR
jgi:hypothetical protein